jgi:hypothetical protein
VPASEWRVLSHWPEIRSALTPSLCMQIRRQSVGSSQGSTWSAHTSPASHSRSHHQYEPQKSPSFARPGCAHSGIAPQLSARHSHDSSTYKLPHVLHHASSGPTQSLPQNDPTGRLHESPLPASTAASLPDAELSHAHNRIPHKNRDLTFISFRTRRELTQEESLERQCEIRTRATVCQPPCMTGRSAMSLPRVPRALALV